VSLRARGLAAPRWPPLVAALGPASLVAAALLAAWPGPATGYDSPTHRILTAHAWPPGLAAAPAPAGPEDLAALRQAVWEAGAGHADAAVRAAFLARWPEAGRFDGWALKALLGLTPEARVSGLDFPPPAPASGAPLAPPALAALASVDPDEDGRNQDRFAHAADRSVRRDAWGRPLPADPAQLDLGALTGLSSQAWAHYALPDLQFSEDPEVLKREPRRFAIPVTVRSFAADSAQLHTDLALAAATLGTPGARALAVALLGAAQHYLEDAANPVHTIQAVYPFFVSARLEALKEDARTLGGLLGPRRGFVPIGIHVISNHHLFAEALWSSRLQRGAAGPPGPETPPPAGAEAGRAGLLAIAAGDGALEAALDALRLGPDGPFARGIVEALADASSREAGDLYLAARAVARGRLSTAAYEFPDGGDPDADLSPDAAPAELARFLELQRRGMARAGTAVRRHVALAGEALGCSAGPGGFTAEPGGLAAGPAGQPVAAAEASPACLAIRRGALARLVAGRLAALQDGEARLAAWQPEPPPRSRVDWGWPAGAALLLASAGLLIRALRRRRARR